MKNNEKYDWDTWFKKRRFVLAKGRDFDCLVHGMAQQVRNKARKRDKVVSIHISDDALVIEVVGSVK